MAMGVGPADDDSVISAINTTPLVDVMLVLLIIFLITIPVVTTSIPVQLPKERVEVRETKPENIVISVDKAMSVTILRETDGIEKQLGILATIGSVSPFVGLFGTVWGIMNSFTAIAARHDTTLAVVAPGIAEALFATAMGLLAAIPAVIFYNRFVAEIGRYVNLLDAFSDEFSAILSRQLDEKVR
jgi:biopolymer transport protein TolQ